MKTTIQKAREWAVLLTGLALMGFCAYSFYYRTDVDTWVLIGGFLLGVLLLAQPTRLNDVFDVVFSKLRSSRKTYTVNPSVDPPKDGGDPPKI